MSESHMTWTQRQVSMTTMPPYATSACWTALEQQGSNCSCLCYHLHLLSSQLRKPAAMQKQHTGLLPTSMAPMDIFAELIVSRRFLNTNNVVHHAEPPSTTAELIAMIFKTLPDIFPYSISLLSILSKIRGQFFNSFLIDLD